MTIVHGIQVVRDVKWEREKNERLQRLNKNQAKTIGVLQEETEQQREQLALMRLNKDLDKIEDTATRRAIRSEALIDGVTRYAWWNDGAQTVGTCGTTLKKAIEDIRKEEG